MSKQKRTGVPFLTFGTPVDGFISRMNICKTFNLSEGRVYLLNLGLTTRSLLPAVYL